ncbi:MAG TPA: TadE/TadG family type IV pilus assembly protein [Propionicimonas sp.]|jgi:Flp pilus assembly protein TadG|uniref:TadE/TadG family type IV pilus assembly protein n=1 Tax=Propionicimonas sp. TaxID=1955623 RepID=UPI002F3ECE48
MFSVKRERGAAAVEFALLLPVLMVILLGIMEFGYAFYIQASVASATRVGIRDYAIHYAQPHAQDDARALARSGVPNPAYFVSGTFSGTCTDGAQNTLVVTYRYRSLTGLLDKIVGTNVIVTGKASMQCGG